MAFNYPSPSIQKFFNDEGTFWSITAYFTDPANICSKNISSQPQSNANSLGDRIVIVSDRISVNLPLNESDVNSSFWTRGKCFWTMGRHYWGDVSGQVNAETKVDNFLPFFLMYNNRKLNAFGWVFNADLSSPRYEHPSVKMFKYFTNEVPKEFLDPTMTGILSSMHIYFDKTPRLNFC